MAEQDDNERTEDPTQKKLDDALQRGDVAKSQEVNTWFVIAGGTLVLMSFAGSMSQSLSTSMRGLLANSYAIRVEGRGFLPVVQKTFPKETVLFVGCMSGKRSDMACRALDQAFDQAEGIVAGRQNVFQHVGLELRDLAGKTLADVDAA